MSNLSNIIKIPSFTTELNISAFFTKEESFYSAKYVSELREEIGGRYRKEIGDAFNELFKKPKKEWPKLLK